jgi:hypothetical protein
VGDEDLRNVALSGPPKRDAVSGKGLDQVWKRRHVGLGPYSVARCRRSLIRSGVLSERDG